MATKAIPDTAACSVRVVLWLALWAATLVDWLRHRAVKGRGWQLQRGLVTLLSLVTASEVFQLLFAVTGSVPVLGMYVVAADVADSFFLCLVLLISCGYSITRTTLGWYKGKALGLPITYGVLILLVDIIILVDNPGAFTSFEDPVVPDYSGDYSDYGDYGSYNDTLAGMGPDPEEDAPATNGWLALVAVLAAVASLLCWVLGVLFVFEFVKLECQALEEAIQRSEGAAAPPASSGIAPVPNTTFAGMGDPDADALDTPDAQQQQQADPYGPPPNVHEVVTVEDAVSHRDKSNILKRFRVGVYCYATAYFIVIVLPVFSPSGLLPQTLIHAFNLVSWGFTAWLVWIFRLREDNPYLLIDEEGRVRGQAGGTALDVSQLDTELGVMSPAEEAVSDEETMGTRLVTQAPTMSELPSVDPNDVSNFTLTEDDPNEWEVQPPTVEDDPGAQSGTPSKQVKKGALSMWPKKGGSHKD
mmetsp:Transcript_37045/g.93576  ORF Transcript_37045/g.93576 Transcript_37045/m.93576 type:complete len:472 (-) Transcript_37045:376-1791(-)